MTVFELKVPGALVAVIAMVVAGCGGGGSSSVEDSSPPATTTTTSASARSGSDGVTRSESSDPGPSVEFLGTGVNGRLAAQGKEADPIEREAVSDVIEASQESREVGNFMAQCFHLDEHATKEVEKRASGLGVAKDCLKILEEQAKRLPAAARASTLTGPINALRVKGDRGYAFYHGTRGKDYVIPVRKEKGEWKLEALWEQEIR
ncbi:MAG: hypothetical protein WBL45_11750 [Solirubrobacterales bacterium]